MSRASSLYGEEYSNSQLIKDLWFFFRKHKFQFIFFTIVLAAAYGLELIPPIILANIVDFFGTTYTSIQPFYNMLWLLLGIMVLATILRHVSKYYLGVFSIKIQKAIDSIEGKTLIVAAHRLTTLQNMDRIIFIEGGKIVEEETYQGLIDKKGKFYNLWRSQKY